MYSEIHTLFEVIYRPYISMNTHIRKYLYVHICINTYIWAWCVSWHEGMMVNLCMLLLPSFNKLQSVFWKLQIFSCSRYDKYFILISFYFKYQYLLTFQGCFWEWHKHEVENMKISCHFVKHSDLSITQWDNY